MAKFPWRQPCRTLSPFHATVGFNEQVKSCQVRLRILWQQSSPLPLCFRTGRERGLLPSCVLVFRCKACARPRDPSLAFTKVESSASVCAANTHTHRTHTRTRAHSPKIQSSTRPKCCVSEPKILTWGRYRLSSRGTQDCVLAFSDSVIVRTSCPRHHAVFGACCERTRERSLQAARSSSAFR